MKAALLYGIGDLRLVDIPKPEFGPDEVLTKVTVCAVCPTDIRKYRVGNGGVLQFPFNMGHEWVGEVVEVGKDVDDVKVCLLYTSPSPRDGLLSRMPSSA